MNWLEAVEKMDHGEMVSVPDSQVVYFKRGDEIWEKAPLVPEERAVPKIDLMKRTDWEVMRLP